MTCVLAFEATGIGPLTATAVKREFGTLAAVVLRSARTPLSFLATRHVKEKKVFVFFKLRIEKKNAGQVRG